MQNVWRDAVFDKKVAEIEKLAKSGQAVDQKITSMTGGFAALYWAADNRWIEGARKLIELGANVNLPGGSDHYTPLMKAIQRQDMEMVKLLIAKGADVDAKTDLGKSVHEVAQFAGGKQIALYVLEHSKGAAKPEATTDHFVVALRDRKKDLAVTLLQKGADPNAKYREGMTVLGKAAEYGYDDVVGLLLKKGAKADVKDSDERNVLHYAAASEEGNPKVIELLVKEGKLAVDSQDDTGNTPLMLAASVGKVDVIATLLKLGADVNRANGVGKTPLIFAAYAEKEKAVETLLNAGANPWVSDKDGLGYNKELRRWIGANDRIDETIRNRMKQVQEKKEKSI